MRIRKMFLTWICMFVLLLCCSCAGDKKELTSEEMPAIVFMRIMNYTGDNGRGVKFLDNLGNFYYTDDSYIEHMSAVDIYQEFVDGKLNEILVLKTSCEYEKVCENYELLKMVARNKRFELIPDSNVDLDVEVDTFSWLGFYYNEKGELSTIIIRTKNHKGAGITCYANDENANKIYEWFENVR